MTASAPHVLASKEYTFTELDLFMFSAAVWLTHRIHFDREYARSEGFEDLVVHGPLQGAHLSTLLQDLAQQHGGALSDLRYRHHEPIVCGEAVKFDATLPDGSTDPRDDDNGLSVSVDVQVTGRNGKRFVTGSGVIRFTDRERALALLSSAE